MADLNEFLRQAAERRKQREQQAATSNRPPQTTPQRTAVFPQRAEPPVVLEAEIVEVPAASVRDRHLGKLRPTISDSHLAREIELADDKMVEHLNQVFDHPVGTIPPRSGGKSKRTTGQPKSNVEGASAPTESTRKPAVLPQDIIVALRSPVSVRTAFVLSEILQRRFS